MAVTPFTLCELLVIYTSSNSHSFTLNERRKSVDNFLFWVNSLFSFLAVVSVGTAPLCTFHCRTSFLGPALAKGCISSGLDKMVKKMA